MKTPLPPYRPVASFFDWGCNRSSVHSAPWRGWGGGGKVPKFFSANYVLIDLGIYARKAIQK